MLAALILAPASAAAADNLAGQASVIDGDTLEIHGTRIRLWGIDAPDDADALGHAAATAHGWPAGHQHPQHVIAALARLAQAGEPMLGPVQ